MGRVSVAEAAERLDVNVQRIHQRIREGSLPAERVGSQWAIDEADVARVSHLRSAGRPLSERSAWALAAVASGDSDALAHLDAPSRSRARARLWDLLAKVIDNDLDSAAALLAHALRNRARRIRLSASLRDLPDVRDDKRVHLSGVSLPESNIASGDLVEGYVAARDLDALIADYLLSPADRSGANVILHVVGPGVEAFASEHVAHSALVRAADLSEHDGVRERNEAVKSVADLYAQLVAKSAHVTGLPHD